MADFNFKQDLDIDKNRLDMELMEQAQKMLRYGSAHAQAMYVRDRAVQSKQVTKAQLIQSIRAKALADGEKMGAGGVTDAVVDARLRSSPTYIEAQEKCFKAEEKVNLIFSAVMAMNARRSMLENLIKLYLNGYWSEPRVNEAQAMDRPTVATEGAILNSMGPVAQSLMPGPGQDQPDDQPNPIKSPDTIRMVQDQPMAQAPESMPSPLMYIIENQASDCLHGPFPELSHAIDNRGSVGQIIVELHRLDAHHRKVIKEWDEQKYYWAASTSPVQPGPLPEVKAVPPCPPSRPPAPPKATPPGPTPVPRPVPRKTGPDDVPF